MVIKDNPSTVGDWIKELSTNVGFMKADESTALDHAPLKLRYSDTNKWEVLQDLIGLAGPIVMHYIGEYLGKPTYELYDHTLLPQAPKHVGSDEVFNIRYLKDFADVYNVLTARASYTLTTEQYTLNSLLEVKIKPDANRPNMLGRLKEKIIQSDSIKDIFTLTEWAYSVYDEHRYPSIPIDFDTSIDSFWIEAKLGQPLTIHGLEDGKGIVEKLNRVSIDTASGTMSVELAKRVNLASALIQARSKTSKT